MSGPHRAVLVDGVEVEGDWPRPVSPPGPPGAEARAVEARRAERATRFGATLRPEDVRVLHEDADAGVLVVLKPAGAYVEDVHEALRRSRADATLTLPHRLDRDTSGCLALATTPEANRSLARAFREGDVGKTYVARCLPPRDAPAPAEPAAGAWVEVRTGHGRAAHGLWRVYDRADVGLALPGRKPSVVKAMATRLLVLNDAAEAEERPARSPRFIVAEPATGRTHQIRLHCAHVGLSLEGDVKYGGRGRGGSGDDSLQGDGGRDTIDGGRGNDTLAGGRSNDVFVFKRAAGDDLVTDFEDGVDLIDISAFGFNSFSQISAAVSNSGGDTVIDWSLIGGEGQLIIVGAAGTINGVDFIF